MKLSVIIPVYNERGNIIPLLQSVYAALSGFEYELILIDDGSADDTVAMIRQHKNERTILLVLDHNSGQSAALRAGIEHSRYDSLITMDGDLQNDPADIPALVDALYAGPYDMIQGYRKNRYDSLTKKLPSTLANLLIRSIFGVPTHDIGCSLKAFRRSAVNSLVYFRDFHRYIPLQAHIKGVKIGELVVHHHPRHSGISKYGLSRTARVIEHLWLFQRRKIHTLPSVSYAIKQIF